MNTTITHNPKLSSWIIFLPSSVAILIPLLLPNDFLSHTPVLQSLIGAIAAFIPGIQKFVSVSDFPEVTTVFLVTSWILLPAQISTWLWLLWRPGVFEKIVDTANNQTAHGVIKLIATASVGTLFMGYALLFLPIDPAFVGHYGMNSSRVGLAIFGACGFFAFALSSAILLFLITNLITKAFTHD